MKAWTLALTSLVSFMTALDAMVVTLSLATIRVQLHASIEELEWTVSAYALSFAVFLMTGAALGDRFGRRRVFVLGLGIFVAASAACALAENATWLIAARIVQGLGAALVTPLAMALLSAAFPREERGKALGIFASISGLALIAGPVVGGIVTQGLTWQWIFWINVPIGLIAIPLALARIRESTDGGSSFDVPGIALITGGAGGIVWGLVRGNNAGWTSTEVIASLGIGVLLAAAFVIFESRASEPMVPLRFFRSRAFASGNAANFFYYGTIYGTLFFLGQFFQTAQGYGPIEAGLRLLPWTATLFVVAPISGAMINRLGERPLIIVGIFLQAVGLGWIAAIATPGVAYAHLLVPLIVAGIGGSMAMPALQNSVLSAVAPTEVGKASGTFNMLRFLGGVFGIAVVSAVFASTGGFGSAGAFCAGFGPAMGVAAGLSFIGALIALSHPSTTLRSAQDDTRDQVGAFARAR